MLMELAAFIITMSSRVLVRDSYESGLWTVFTDAYGQNRSDLIKAVEDLEREFECCGVRNSTDYIKENYTIPASCYQNQSFDKPKFQQGCADAIIDWIWDELPVIGSVIGALLLIEICGLIASIALTIAISHSSHDELYAKL